MIVDKYSVDVVVRLDCIVSVVNLVVERIVKKMYIGVGVNSN